MTALSVSEKEDVNEQMDFLILPLKLCGENMQIKQRRAINVSSGTLERVDVIPLYSLLL